MLVLQHQHSVLVPGPRPGLDLNVSAAKPTMLVLQHQHSMLVLCWA